MNKKIARDLCSIKLWILILATVLLVTRLIGSKEWVAAVGAVAGLRELASYRYAKLKVNEESEGD